MWRKELVRTKSQIMPMAVDRKLQGGLLGRAAQEWKTLEMQGGREAWRGWKEKSKQAVRLVRSKMVGGAQGTRTRMRQSTTR